MEASKILEGIKKEQGGTRFIGCKSCKAVTTWIMTDTPPAQCAACQSTLGFVMGLSFVEVKSKLTAEPTPAPAPAPAPAKSKRTRAAKVALAETKTPETAPDMGSPGMVTDLKEIRRAAIQHLISTRGLNRVDFLKVGVAQVFTLGFTRWADGPDGSRLPSYCFKELTDDSPTFNALLTRAKNDDPKVKIDVAMLTAIEPADLCDTLFSGQLIAGIFHKNGPVLACVGARVEVGARVTDHGNLIFQVLRVI